MYARHIHGLSIHRRGEESKTVRHGIRLTTGYGFFGYSWSFGVMVIWSTMAAKRLVWLRALAALFAASVVTYSFLWIWQTSRGVLGIGVPEMLYQPETASLTIRSQVVAGRAADLAGLRQGDRIVAIDGKPLRNLVPLYKAIVLRRNGFVDLLVERSNVTHPLHVRLNTTAGPGEGEQSVLQSALLVYRLYPLGLLAIGLTVLFLKPDSADAWRLSILFAGFIGIAPLFETSVPGPFRGFAVAFQLVPFVCAPGIFYAFFAAFPGRTPIDRWFPWLKIVFWVLPLFVVSVPAVLCLFGGGAGPLYEGVSWPGAGMLVGLQGTKDPLVLTPRFRLASGYALCGFGLGLFNLVWNAFVSPDREIQRKARVIFWGALIGNVPFLSYSFLIRPMQSSAPAAILFGLIAVLLVAIAMPLSMAYAILKHRVLDIPVLVRRGARYLLVQRGFLVTQLLIAVCMTWAFLDLAGGGKNYGPAVLLGAVIFGSALAVIGERVHRRIGRRIDRAFFRSAYDARQVLENLALATRSATSREQLADLLAREVSTALNPLAVGIYLSKRNKPLLLMRGNCEPPTMEKDTELSTKLGAGTTAVGDTMPSPIAFCSPQTSPECLVPILEQNGKKMGGLLALGPKQSEESYSREDMRLLRAVAVQAGIVLESMNQAEQIANHLETERRTHSELDVARQVQSRLFPQRQPELHSLDYLGACTQARQVGGDYYDYLDLGHGRIGLVLADISGKGIAAALLVANLQANLRGQYALALDDLPWLLKSVNRLLYANTAENKYATLFYADYDDASNILRYVNCGHPAAILLRRDGAVENLESDCTVVGLFAEIDILARSTVLSSGDTLLIYSDGLSEAQNRDGEEFGEHRLVDVMREAANQPIRSSLDMILGRVTQFSAGEQFDDMTAILARGR